MKVVLLNQIPEVNNKYTFSLAQGVMKKNVDITICGIHGDDVSTYYAPFIDIFDSYSKKNNVLSKIVSYYRSYLTLENYCIKNKIDILHLQWYVVSPLDFYFIRRMKIRGIKIVVTIHDLLPFNKKPFDFYFHKKIYKAADAVISQAILNKKPLLNEFLVKEESIHYVPHGHYMEYANKIDSDVARERLGISHNRKVVLFFGQIKKVKGVDVLIKAMQNVVKNCPNALCVIAGKVWKDDFSIYQRLIEELGLVHSVKADIRFISDEEIKYYFEATDVVALPYRKIYQSGVVLLAAAYEKPIVATSEGEFVQVIKDKETGLLVRAEDENELANAICWYFDHPDKARDYAKACKKDLEIRLSWDTIAEQIVNIYNSMLRVNGD
jgi:glycosyltransferase involved in cell wall biosynthesis